MKSKSMYENSELGRYLTKLIKDVKAVKKLTAAEKDIQSVIKIILTALKLADESLRCFDNKEIPSKFQLASLGVKYAVIFSYKGAFAALKIKHIKKDHAHFLNLVKQSIDGLLKILPENIEDLLPFVNFQKLPALLNEGFIMDKAKKFLVEKIPCHMKITRHTVLTKIKHKRFAAYYLNYKSKQLFYINETTEERKEILLDLNQWNALSQINKGEVLTKSDFAKIKKITNHFHVGKLKYHLDYFSINEKLTLSFKASLVGKNINIQKITQSANINEFYKFFILLVKNFKLVVTEKKEFLKSFVTFIRDAKNSNLFAAANYYLAFINAVAGDLKNEEDVAKILGKKPLENPANLIVAKEYDVNKDMHALQSIIVAIKEEMNRKNAISADTLNIMLDLLNKEIAVAINLKQLKYFTGPSLLPDDFYRVMTEAESLRASVQTLQVTLDMLAEYESHYTAIKRIDDVERQDEMKISLLDQDGIFQKRYRLLEYQNDNFYCQTVLEKMHAFKARVIGGEAVPVVMSLPIVNEQKSVAVPKPKPKPKPEPEPEPEPRELPINQSNSTPISDPNLSVEVAKSTPSGRDETIIDNLIEALQFYRHRIEANQNGDVNDFCYGFSIFTKYFKSHHRKANYELAETLIKELKNPSCVSMRGLFAKDNVQLLRKNPKLSFVVRSKDLNYIFTCARNGAYVDVALLQETKENKFKR